MRYGNWDVLLFPNGSKIPLQEFRTGCYITQEPGQGSDRSGLPDSYAAGMPRYLPTVTSFVPNIPLGSPLNISVHSWEAPIAGPDTVALAQQADWIWFEASVLVDGMCTAGIFFNQQASWPQVVDTCSYPNKDGVSMPLTFPAFHPELLTQSYWNAGEHFGRIKIVIAEGIMRGPNSAFESSAFEKTKSIVCFSFQHAPLRVLEDSGIAFPNPRMIYQLQNQFYTFPSPRKAQGPDPEAHGHSPRQRNTIADATRSRMMDVPPPVYQDCYGFAQGSVPPSNLQFSRPYWPHIPNTYDPSLDSGRFDVFARAIPLSSGDQSMADYSRSLTPTTRNTSNVQDPNIAMVDAVTDDAETLDSFYYSPTRPASNGTVAPANTRVSSAANTPPEGRIKPSAAAEARASSYSHSQVRAVSVTTRDPAKSTIREPSDTSMNCRFSDSASEPCGQAGSKMKRTPAKEVKGRKEGRVSELVLGKPKTPSYGSASHQDKETVEQDENRPRVGSDGKRKRSIASTPAAGRVLSEAQGTSSPSRKISRISSIKDLDLKDELTSEGVVTRAPLADVGSNKL